MLESVFFFATWRSFFLVFRLLLVLAKSPTGQCDLEKTTFQCKNLQEEDKHCA